jgi:hypothetical protein
MKTRCERNEWVGISQFNAMTVFCGVYISINLENNEEQKGKDE